MNKGNFFLQLLKQHRSVRGTLCSRIKSEIFKDFDLHPISVKAPFEEIKNWKNQPKLRKVFFQLFKRERNGKIRIVQVLEKIWPKAELKTISDSSIAYAIGVAEVLLDPGNNNIQMLEELVKPKMMKSSTVSFVLLRSKLLIR